MLALALMVGLAGQPAHADEKEADTCLRTKIWSQYDEGYAVRTATTVRLGAGEHRVFLVTLYEGNEYKMQACGDGDVADLDLIITDAQGNELGRDKTDDREPVVAYTPKTTGTYFMIVHAAQLQAKEGQAGVALAVSYK